MPCGYRRFERLDAFPQLVQITHNGRAFVPVRVIHGGGNALVYMPGFGSDFDTPDCAVTIT